jgi:chemoreceptor-like protein with four helix bundle sensory module
MATMRVPQLRIGTKFALTLAVLVPALAAVGLIGGFGMARINDELTTLYRTNIQIGQGATALGDSLDEADQTALLLVPTVSRSEQAQLNARLDALEPRVVASIEALRRRTAPFPEERAQVERIAAGWQAFLEVRRTAGFDAIGFDRASAIADQRLANRVSSLFDRVTAVAAEIADGEVREAAKAKEHAVNVYHRNLLLLVLVALATLAASAGSVLLLVRNVVPRIRLYSQFAEGVRSGASTERLHPRGSDELADLGRALDEMIVAQGTDREQEAMQAEFVQMMQAAASEDEAYDLLSRQLDRSVDGGRAVVLNRNNSADRL